MDFVVGALALLGAALVVLAGVGVVRFEDLYSRMHAATKATAVGLGFVCLAAALAIDDGAAKALLAGAVVFVTAPCAAHFVGRTAYSAEGLDLRLEHLDDLGAADSDDDADGGVD